jgi:hypothetical protein
MAPSCASSPASAPPRFGGPRLGPKLSSRYAGSHVTIYPGHSPDALAQIWDVSGMRYVRVFHEGTLLSGMEWVGLDNFIQKLRALMPDRLFDRCMGK